MIPFSRPRINQKIIDEVTDVQKADGLQRGQRLSFFEKELTAYCTIQLLLLLIHGRWDRKFFFTGGE